MPRLIFNRPSKKGDDSRFELPDSMREVLDAILTGMSVSAAVYGPVWLHGREGTYPHESTADALRGDWSRVGEGFDAALQESGARETNAAKVEPKKDDAPQSGAKSQTETRG